MAEPFCGAQCLAQALLIALVPPPFTTQVSFAIGENMIFLGKSHVDAVASIQLSMQPGCA